MPVVSVLPHDLTGALRRHAVHLRQLGVAPRECGRQQLEVRTAVAAVASVDD